MEEFIKIEDHAITIPMDKALRFIDCYSDNPLYEELVEEYHALVPKLLENIKPEVYLCFSKAPLDLNELIHRQDTKILYVLITLGEQIDRFIRERFTQGFYLSGLLANAMADAYLLQLDEEARSDITKNCMDRQLGISKRLEAPSDIPLNYQELILNVMKTYDNVKVEVTSGYMFTAMKTMGYLLVLCDDVTKQHLAHDCAGCDKADNCYMKMVNVISS